MNSSSNERKKINKSKKQDLSLRKKFASRRKAGLSPDQEEATLASYLRRFIALGIDSVLLVIFTVCVSCLISILLPPRYAGSFYTYWSVFAFGLVYIIPIIGHKGQTFGCRVMKIVIIKKDGTGFLGFQDSFIRWMVVTGFPTLLLLILVVSFDEQYALAFVFINAILTAMVIAPAFWTENRQGLHDMLARSISIREVKFEDPL